MAIGYAHSRGVIHRDIKPANILIQPDGTVKILDFGIAQFQDHDRNPSITRSGAFVGTISYMAPERLREDIVDGRSDVFSTGVVLFELLTGKLPFSGTDVAIMQGILTEQPPSLQSFDMNYPDSLQRIINKALAKSPNERYSAAEEMASDLEDVLKGLTQNSHKQKRQPFGTPYANETTYESRQAASEVTALNDVQPPTGFYDGIGAPRTGYFERDKDRYIEIKESLTFYRDHLSGEYRALSDQARITFYLWITSIVIGLAALISGVAMLYMGKIAAGSITSIGASFIYFIQRTFQQREDEYRNQATAKHVHLEFGNHWLLIIQSIDTIENSIERQRRQERLVDVLTAKLGANKSVQSRQRRRTSAGNRSKNSTSYENE